jgi:hypothetical protein
MPDEQHVQLPIPGKVVAVIRGGLGAGFMAEMDCCGTAICSSGRRVSPTRVVSQPLVQVCTQGWAVLSHISGVADSQVSPSMPVPEMSKLLGLIADDDFAPWGIQAVAHLRLV